MNLAEKQEASEIKEFRVSEISSLVKRCIDDNFGFVKIRGEVSGLKVATSGHAYFNLKENEAIIACTCWKTVMMRLNFKLEEGMEVIVTGRLTTYPSQSKYQLSAEKIEPSGTGALMELLLKRKEALAKEGLFDESRKKKLPFFPSKIGVITSPVGAVIQDIIHRVKDRCPVTIMLWPVAVQGEQCAFEVSSAINGFNSLPQSQRPDLIIVARGGGSIEDLWGFNEEIVVRATANSEIPIISAIGHETDFTLIDFASSLRAPTPTAAAEIALPVASEIAARIKELDYRVTNTITNNIKHVRVKLDLIYKSFASSNEILYAKYQILDDLSFRLQNSLPNNLKIKNTMLLSLKLPYSVFNSGLLRKKQELGNIFDNTTRSIIALWKKASNDYEINAQLIETMSVKKILSRGFAIARNQDGGVVPSSNEAKNSHFIELEWHDGKVTVQRIDSNNN